MRSKAEIRRKLEAIKRSFKSMPINSEKKINENEYITALKWVLEDDETK